MQRTTIVALALACIVSACGGSEEEQSETAAAANAPTEAAPSVHSCVLRTHCREYRGLPYTVTEGERSMQISEALVQRECSMRRGTWSATPCDPQSYPGVCTEADGHMVWNYPAGDALARNESDCGELHQGTWSTR